MEILMRFTSLPTVGFVLTLVFAGPAIVAAEDMAGSEDHPLLSRYPGFSIAKYSSVAFDRAEFLTGPAFVDSDNNRQLNLDKVEGEVTNIKYVYDAQDVSTYALLANYRSALETLDAEVVFSCEGPEECGMPGVFINNMLNARAHAYSGFLVDVPDDFAMISGIATSGETQAHIMLILGAHHGTGRRYVNQSIITSAALETDKLTIGSLEDLNKGLEETGSVVLDGVLFDFDTADLKPESDDVIAVLYEYMQTFPQSEVFIVGHTDNVGSYDYNVKLSQQRAEAVISALQSVGVAPTRMTGVGIGPVSPVAQNDTPEGQTRNRRVELVVK
jgi:outer membrane protein OmpA-like peptidoglycan-associated protein